MGHHILCHHSGAPCDVLFQNVPQCHCLFAAFSSKRQRIIEMGFGDVPGDPWAMASICTIRWNSMCTFGEMSIFYFEDLLLVKPSIGQLEKNKLPVRNLCSIPQTFLEFWGFPYFMVFQHLMSPRHSIQ